MFLHIVAPKFNMAVPFGLLAPFSNMAKFMKYKWSCSNLFQIHSFLYKSGSKLAKTYEIYKSFITAIFRFKMFYHGFHQDQIAQGEDAAHACFLSCKKIAIGGGQLEFQNNCINKTQACISTVFIYSNNSSKIKNTSGHLMNNKHNFFHVGWWTLSKSSLSHCNHRKHLPNCV